MLIGSNLCVDSVVEMSTQNTKPFDDIRDLVASIPSPQEERAAAVYAKLETATNGLKPLGRLDHVVAWLASWQGQDNPQINTPLVAIFVGTHLVAKDVMGGDLATLSKQRVEAISTGKTAVRGIAAAQGAAFKIYEMGTDQPVADMRSAPSLSEKACAQAIAFGMEVVSEGADLIVLGNAGCGTATAAAGIARGLYGGAAQYWAGGTGETAEKRIEAVGVATHFHKDILDDPLEILRCFGGRDIAGMVGAILAARHQKIPVLLDGYAVCAAAAILHALNPKALDHCLGAHVTTEPAHGALLDRIGKKPLLELGIGIGDGSGAALTIGILKAASAGAAELLS
ncbi:MAG: nicotinate-nucleotide--dimethylbenzimidazole phosphoribosyltransferase [Robiginitomaculum sp.]|nr:MAG: nicotinate-nucleotide--dimethylbenzimidazole phosphoribosyltransferase [Robiginitomaculum sp.]